MENYVICKINNLKDGEPSKEHITLICTEKEFSLLEKHIDKKFFALEEARWVKDTISLNIKGFIDMPEGLETGNKE